jgi:hypothetical protein
MSTYESTGSLVARLLTYFVVALIAIAALKLAFWVFGAALGFGMMLLFTIGPILLVGWIVMKVFRFFTGPTGYE